MKGIRFIKKTWGKLAAFFAFVVLLSLPVFITPATAATSHTCLYMGTMSASQGIGQAEASALIANRDHPENMGLTPKKEPYYFFLTEDISWEGHFVAPEGIVIAICKNGYTVNGSYTNEGTTGGIFYFQCAQHNCLEKNQTMRLVDQSFFDLMLKMFENQASLAEQETSESVEDDVTEGAEKAVEIDVELSVALGADVTVGEDWVLSPSSHLTICTNGYTVTGIENMTAHGGTVTLVDCSKLHDCYYFGSSMMGIGQQDVDGLVLADRTSEAWGMPASEEPYTAYLYEDISWEGTLSAPDGVYIALCLNGHTITGDIDNTKTTNGGIYVMQCGMHDCQIMGDSLMVLSPGYVSLMEVMMEKQGGTIEVGTGQAMALNGDITLTNPTLWALKASESITFCTCGYTITNLEYMTVNGASVRLIDCSNIGPHACEALDGEEAQFITKSNYSEWVDVNTGLFIKEGNQTLCLLGDVKLSKTLIIPSGCNITLCLNGFTITSPQIIWNDQTLGDVCCTAIQVMQGASLTVCDCSPGETGKITVNFEDQMSGWGGLMASAVQNFGSFTLKSGQLVGVMTALNAGEMTVEGGMLLGVLAGVAQATELIEGMGTTQIPTFTMNGGEVHSAALGVLGQQGEISINDGEITAGMIGVGTSLDTSNVEQGSEIYLNGGAISVGSVDAESFQRAGFDIEEDGNIGIDADQCIGIVTGSSLVLGNDVEINVEGPMAEASDYTAEILLGDGATMTKTESAVLENTYEVAVNASGGAATVDPSIAGNVVPATISNASIGENGELVIVPNAGEINPTAKVEGYTLSLKGAIVVNFYVSMQQAFLDNPNARVVILYRGERTAYTKEQAVENNGMYVFSIAVSAKDYQKNINCSFTDGTNVWAGLSVTVNKYLNTILNDTTGTYDKAKDLAAKMQNYCMAASYHFDVAMEYTPKTEIATLMKDVTAETLEGFAQQRTGASENITFAGVTLFLQSTTTIRFYLTVNSGKSIDDAIITVNGETVTPTQSGKYFYIEITDIVARNLGATYTVNFDGIEVQYSALTYAYSVLKAGTFSQDAVDAVKSLYLYYEAAVAYFNAIEEV